MVAGQSALATTGIPGRPRAALLRASLLLLLVAGFSKLTTVAADSFVAAHFGLSADADAYLVAIGLIGALLAAPAETVRLALLPACGAYLRDGKPREAAGVLAWLLLGVAAAGTAGAAVLLFGAPWLAPLAAPGFDGAALDTLVSLTRTTSIALPLGVAAAVLTGALHVQLRFSAPAVTGILLSAGVISMGVLLGGRLGVTALAVGYVSGTAAVVVVLASLSRAIVRQGVAFRETWRDLRRVVGLALPTGLAISIVGAGAVIERAIASATGTGSVAALGFAIKLVTQAGIISQSIWTPLTPLLATTSPDDGHAGRAGLTAFSLKLVLLVLTPATALVIALREPLVAVVFERGAFTAADTSRTATLLALHSGSLVGEGLFMVAVAALLSLHDAGTRLAASVLLIISKLALSLSLAPLIGVSGVALAASVSSLVAGGYAVHVLSRTLAEGQLRELATFGAKAAAAALLALAVASACAQLPLAGASPMGTASARLVVGGGCGLASYVIGLLLLDVAEVRLLLERVRQILARAR